MQSLKSSRFAVLLFVLGLVEMYEDRERRKK